MFVQISWTLAERACHVLHQDGGYLDAIHNDSPIHGIGPSYFYEMFKQSDVVRVTPHNWYEDKLPNTNRKAFIVCRQNALDCQ